MNKALQQLVKFFDCDEKVFLNRLNKEQIIAWAAELGPRYKLSNWQHNLLINS